MGFDPITMTALAVGGGVATAVSGYEKNMATANAQAYQAQVAANNATIDRQNAEQEIQIGEISSANREMKARAQVGKTEAGQGASGVDVNSKSFTDVRAGESELGMLDALTIRSDAARRAYGFNVKAAGDEAQSRLDAAASESAKASAPFEAAGSLLSSAASVGGKYAAWQNVAPGGGKGVGDTTGGEDESFTTGAP